MPGRDPQQDLRERHEVRASGAPSVSRGRPSLHGPLRLLRDRRAKRAAQAYARLRALRELTARFPFVEVVLVQHVYQRSRRGTKALVLMERTGQQHDAWFWWSRVSSGQMAAVQFTEGWGPHTQRDGVLYVGHKDTGHGIYELLSAREVKRASRHSPLWESRR